MAAWTTGAGFFGAASDGAATPSTGMAATTAAAMSFFNVISPWGGLTVFT